MRDVFGFDLPAPTRAARVRAPRSWPLPFLSSVVLVGTTALGASIIEKRIEIVPERADFSAFPMHLGNWEGRRYALEPRIVSVLKVTDYIMADFVNENEDWVNLYVAYYDTQRKGEAVHSPRACIPGGGWEITGLTTRLLPPSTAGARPLRVNRVEIQRGAHKQLVYYWFQQRGRLLTSEYLVKVYLLWDALWRRRTDGGLVRITTPLRSDEPWSIADARLTRFSHTLGPPLDEHVPK